MDYAAPMKRRTIAVAVLFPLGALALARMMALMVWNQAPMGPIYALAQVQAGLYRHSQAWVGRTVRVRAQIDVLEGYGTASNQSFESSTSITLGPNVPPYAAPGVSYPAVSLVVQPGKPSALLPLLRRFPVIRNIVSVPDLESTLEANHQNIGSPKIFVLHLLPRGQAFDATLLNVE